MQSALILYCDHCSHKWTNITTSYNILNDLNPKFRAPTYIFKHALFRNLPRIHPVTYVLKGTAVSQLQSHALLPSPSISQRAIPRHSSLILTTQIHLYSISILNVTIQNSIPGHPNLNPTTPTPPPDHPPLQLIPLSINILTIATAQLTLLLSTQSTL